METRHRRKKDLRHVSRRTFNRRVQDRIDLANAESIAAVDLAYAQGSAVRLDQSVNPIQDQRPLGVEGYNHSNVVNELEVQGQDEDQLDIQSQIQTQGGVPVEDDQNFEFLNDYHTFNDLESALSSDSDISFIDEDEVFRKKLAAWAKETNITLLAVTKLLLILRVHGHPYLPKVGQTLLETPSCAAIVEVDPGMYVHIGIEKNIVKLLKNNKPPENLLIEIDFNIDGVPVTNSTKKQLWPILGRCASLSTTPFPVGIYYGLKKPESSSEFLKLFVTEMEKIRDQGILFNRSIYFLKINAFICDAPAKSFVKCIVGHNGYHGCGKCTQHGEWNGRTFFPETNFQRRTDLQFINREDEDHHNGYSILESLGIGMVSQFPGDYLHLLCLGTMKKLLLFWIKGPLLNRLPAFKQQLISTALLAARQTQPAEFQRRIRGLDDISFFKGTEFRTFLFYTGPVVLKNILSMAEYKNFLALHIACIICNNKKFHQFLEVARKLFEYFVESFSEIYGEKYLSYNIHNLLHVVDDCELFGTLEDFSAYPFESLLGKIKKKVRQGNKILQQVVNRITEGWDIEIEVPTKVYPILKKRIFSNELETHYSHFQNKNLFLKNDLKNCYFMTKALDVYKFEYVRKTEELMSICCRKFLAKNNLYSSPLESSLLGIFNLNENSLSCDVDCIMLNEIKCKVFVIKHDEIMAAYPMHDLDMQ